MNDCSVCLFLGCLRLIHWFHRGKASLSSIGLRSQERARLLKFNSRIARVERRRVPIAEVAEEVRLDGSGWHFVVFASSTGCRKKLRSNLRVVKAGHRTAVQTNSACRQNEIRALKRAVAEGGDVGEFGCIGKKITHTRIVWEQRRHPLVEEFVV